LVFFKSASQEKDNKTTFIRFCYLLDLLVN
jgi:hypothetical protein